MTPAERKKFEAAKARLRDRNRRAGKKPMVKVIERHRFKLCFGAIFADCSDTMVQKCWRRFANLPLDQRGGLLAELQRLAVMKAAKTGE